MPALGATKEQLAASASKPVTLPTAISHSAGVGRLVAPAGLGKAVAAPRIVSAPTKQAVAAVVRAPSSLTSRASSYLESTGLPKAAAQGIAATLTAESGGRTTAEGSEGAYGLAQWLGSRRAGLESFARDKGQPPSSERAQLEYLAHELHTSEAGTLNELRSASSPQEAADTFIKSFERPAAANIPAVEQRAAAALGGASPMISRETPQATTRATILLSLGLSPTGTQSGGSTPKQTLRQRGLELLASEQEPESPLAGVLEAKAQPVASTASGVPATGTEAQALAQAPPNLQKPAVAPVRVALPKYIQGIDRAKGALERQDRRPVSIGELEKAVGFKSEPVAETPHGTVHRTPTGPVFFPKKGLPH
jgi:Phage tail lysozyme